MFGLSINLLMDTEQNVNIRGMESLTNLVWSTYDRIHFREVKSFRDYFISDPSLTEWTGNIQSLHLYASKNETKLGINAQDNKGNYLYDTDHPDNKYSLGMILSVKMNDLIFSKNNNEDNKAVIDCIRKNISLCKFNLHYDIFFSLGEEDMVLIFLGNSIDEFLIVVNLLRNIVFDNNGCQEHIYSQTYSFVFQNSDDFDCISVNQFSYADIYLSLIDGVNENAFCTEFSNNLNKIIGEENEIKPSLMIGEYDIRYTVPEEKINCQFFKMYSSGDSSSNLLNGKSAFYQKNILRSKTVWCCNFERIKSQVPKSINYHCSCINTNDIIPNVSVLEERIEKLIRTTALQTNNCKTELFFVYNNVVSFLKEVKLILSSVTNRQWQYIVHEQITAFLNAYDTYKGELETNTTLVENINNLITDMRMSFYHINRSKDMFYDIPTNSLQYSGSLNKILMAYYGFINELLRIAFNKPHNIVNHTEQSNIVFFIYFSMSPKICSYLYFNDNSRPNEEKIVVFNLPYSALYEFEKYFISLTHEVYHLIAPVDREERNRKLLKLWTVSFIKNEINNILRNQLPEVFSSINSQIVNIPNEDSGSIDYTTGYAKLIELFVDEYSIDLYNISDYITKANYETFNSLIEYELINNNKTKDYYHIVFDKFIEFCNKFNNAGKQEDSLTRCACIINREINARRLLNNSAFLMEDYSIDRNNLMRTKSMLSCIKESLCDTNTLFLAYIGRKYTLAESAIMYLSYLLDFFHSTGVDYENNPDAIMRIKILFYYCEHLPTKKELLDNNLSERDVDKVYAILSNKETNAFDTQEAMIIKNIIKQEDFLNACEEYYSGNELQSIIHHALQTITKYITSVLPDSPMAFTNILNTVVSLNRPFKLANKDDIPYTPAIISERPSTDIQIMSSEEIYPHMDTLIISSFEGYLKALKRTKQVAETNPKEPVWYRGICNSGYKLLPSLYINLPKDTNPYYYQQALLRQSYYETRKHYLTFIENEQPLAARQALMQHYGVPTNLLDFSTDPLSALYWALNPENEKDRQRDESLDPPHASVYAFYPHRYEKAYQYLYDHIINEQADNGGIYGIYTHNSLNYEYIISEERDREAKSRIEEYNEELKIYSDTMDEKYLYRKRPIPIVVPQKNIRINSQEGTFVAYNFFALPLINKSKKQLTEYDYLSLADLQEKYVFECIKNGDKFDSLFLERIIISKFSKQRIKTDLDAIFGYTIKKVYPDIPHLLGDVKGNTVGYQKK